MAVIDPRVLRLIETLMEVGADWLAFDLIEVIARGHEPLESADTLAATREQVRQANGTRLRQELAASMPTPKPMSGDDQVELAAVYVSDRIEDALQDLESSLLNLETIVGLPFRSGNDDPPKRHNVALVFVDAETTDEVSTSNIDKARSGLELLREALLEWSTRARGPSA